MSNKVTIIGAGSVGSTIAYTMAINNIASEIVMIDVNTKKALGEAMSQPDCDAETLSNYGKELDEIQQKLNAMPVVDAMTSARQQFSAIMNQVNSVLEYIITGELQQGGGCSGNCSGCSGCH